MFTPPLDSLNPTVATLWDMELSPLAVLYPPTLYAASR